MNKTKYPKIETLSNKYDDFIYIRKDINIKWMRYKLNLPKGSLIECLIIPKFIFFLLRIDKFDKNIITALVFHEMCYTPLAMTRNEADEILYDILVNHGMSPVKASYLKLYLRLTGWYYYKYSGKYSKKNIKKICFCDFVKVNCYYRNRIIKE